ncbi:MAG: glycine cleavage system protein H [Candidatus Melainabacteria bacterium RIFCSPHIGHO2_02_FULL_34_12]|nr:MAG: glycine cleavage system protein H [Candidatus Melainabacteria bacterium RIFCSPHIGHO2_02_FULL_34_12]
MNFPKDLKYTKSHEYIKINGNQATIGITSYASNELGDVVFVELPDIGKTFQSGEKFGVIESVKSVSDLYIPNAGKIIEVNKDLNDHPEYINQDTYSKGWMIKIELTSDPNQNKELISADEYSKFVLAQAH